MQGIGLAFVVAAGLVLAGTAGAAEIAAPAPADGGRVGRYTMVPAEGGFVRLDTETGVISHCRREPASAEVGWRCAVIPEAIVDEADGTGALAGRVDALDAEVARLKARLDALASPPQTGDPDFDRALGFGEEIMRRFFGLMREMKNDPGDPGKDAVRP